MRNLFTGIIASSMAITIAAVIPISAFAGTWQTSNDKWWYDNGNGTWAANGWQWIDGNGDGISECYYFDQNGWLLTDTMTPDNYQVDVNGAWTVDGQVQQQKAETQAEDMGWVEAYADILTNYKNPVGFKTAQFQLFYLNEDSIPELSVHGKITSHHQPADLYTYYNGQAVRLGEFGTFGGFSYREKQNCLFWSDVITGVGGETYDFYQLQNGIMVPLNQYSATNMDNSYFKNGSKISESEYQNSLAADLGDKSTHKSAPASDTITITPSNIQKLRNDPSFAIR